MQQAEMKWIVVLSLVMLIWEGEVFAACLTAVTPVTPSADFVNNGDGTMTNTKTKLMWKRCSEGQSGANCGLGKATVFSWKQALQSVQTLNQGIGFATYHDWRVPNIKELRSIVERQCVFPTINLVVFPATPQATPPLTVPASPKIWYWSATPYATVPSDVWYIDFDSGRSFAQNTSAKNHIRLVRGGQ